MHRLDVPRAPGQYRHRLRGHCQRSSLAGVRQVSDHDGRVLLYDVDDRVELDRVGQVVDEKDEKAEAREEQQDCAGDREPRKLLDAAAAGYADCVKPRRTVGEGRDEHAEHDLVVPVAEEVAQQPGGVLAGRDLQRYDGKTEHDGHDRDHRAGRPDE